MKKLILFLAVLLSISSCKKEVTYTSFGKTINDTDVLDADRMLKKYEKMKKGDTINTKIAGTIGKVCAAKGCWMTLDIDGKNEVMIKFKDYGFFVPTNAEGDVVINGKAFVTETSVDELKHYAQDAGKSKEAIEAITEPKLTYSFEADGVLLKTD